MQKKSVKTKPLSKVSKKSTRKKKPVRGGKREGAGAKKQLPGDARKATYEFRVVLLDAMAYAGIPSRAAYIQTLIARDLLSNHKIDSTTRGEIQELLNALIAE